MSPPFLLYQQQGEQNRGSHLAAQLRAPKPRSAAWSWGSHELKYKVNQPYLPQSFYKYHLITLTEMHVIQSLTEAEDGGPRIWTPVSLSSLKVIKSWHFPIAEERCYFPPIWIISTSSLSHTVTNISSNGYETARKNRSPNQEKLSSAAPNTPSYTKQSLRFYAPLLFHTDKGHSNVGGNEFMHGGYLDA